MGSIKPLIALIFTLTFSVWLCAGIPTPTLPDSATHHGLNLYDDIEWTGPVAPGGGNYTFFGSVESIKAQIESTPGFDPSVFNTASTVNESDLLLKRGGNYIIDCSRTSDQRSGASLLDYISALDKVKNFHGSCSITGRACKRFGCGKDGSIGLCDTRETPFNIECKEIFRLADILINTLMGNGGALALGIHLACFSRGLPFLLLGHKELRTLSRVHEQHYCGLTTLIRTLIPSL
ncbi:hypothetical protein TWF191_000684 [Orbilia oligospora]|uniref:Uncharacterized protein n=1 Tax=Orbilia oligospora TaxID=2813651 RepID=A0A7C8QEW5_ORBOL|nr:hypothetical protein TWF191_000684 [Orbilia oligospora]KAF3214911.1 hypothetical protein TWF679_004689 [Orbilia oligospora]